MLCVMHKKTASKKRPKPLPSYLIMAIWNRLWGTKNNNNKANIVGNEGVGAGNTSLRYAFVDTEIGMKNHQVRDIGALRSDGAIFHQASKAELLNFLRDVDFICGHNIVHHDAKCLLPMTSNSNGIW